MESGTTTVSSSLDVDRVQDLLRQTCELLEQSDVKVEKSIDELKSLLVGFAHAEVLERLAARVEVYEFDEALELTTELLARLRRNQ